jgi:hypothetical protein
MRVRHWIYRLVGPGPTPDPRELERIHAEAGMPGGAVTPVNPTSARDVAVMEAWFGVDPERVPLHWVGPVRDAERVCGSCEMAARCHRWQKRPAAGDDPMRFCPNALLFAELAAVQWQGG